MSRNRISKAIILPKRILILCEGLSEKIYLKGIQSDEQNRRKLANTEIEIYQPEDYSPYGLLTEAKRKKREANKDKMPYHNIWIVFDKDGHENIAKTFEESKDSDINIAFSLICFEYWILLHFEKTSAYFKNCNLILSYIKKKNYLDYNKTNYYSQISDNDKIEALKNAAWLHKQNKTDIERGIKIYNLSAYTSFDKLYNYLISL